MSLLQFKYNSNAKLILGVNMQILLGLNTIWRHICVPSATGVSYNLSSNKCAQLPWLGCVV